MRFSLEQLRAFSLSVEAGSFSAAARKLGKGQSAVSTAIANLELDLGVSLFDRQRREPTLTEQGQALLPHVEALLMQAQRLQRHADALSAGEEGQLTLAVEESLVSEPLDELLVRFEAAFPMLELELLYPSRQEILDLVARGRVDMGLMITANTVPDGFTLMPCKELLFIPVASPQHRLAREKIVSFDQLVNLRQLVLTSYGGGVLPEEQISRKIWKVESQYGVVELVKRGLGWGYVPRHLATPWIKRGELVELMIAGDRFATHRPVDLITATRYQAGRASNWLSQELPLLPFLV